MEGKLDLLSRPKTLGSAKNKDMNIFLTRIKDGTYSRNSKSRAKNSKTLKKWVGEWSRGDSRTLKSRADFVRGVSDLVDGIGDKPSEQRPQQAPQVPPAVKEESKNANENEENNENENNKNENNKPAPAKKQEESGKDISAEELLQAFLGPQKANESVEQSNQSAKEKLDQPSESRKSRSRSDNNHAKEPLEEDTEYALRKDEERLALLNAQNIKCKEDCKLLDKEIKELTDIQQKKSIEGITIASNSKLIDLLIQRVLDPSPEWKKHIDTLINIPTSLKGEGYLRGGDYFEALFQLAIAIGVLPQFQGKFVRFYDIKDYRTMPEIPNYLYTKTVQNSGGGEQGISDISFEVSSNQEFSPKISNEYECGQIPVDVSNSKKAKGNPFYFISVKGYKKEKSIKSEYDIPILDQQLQMFKDIDKHIIVCVRDKDSFNTNLSRSRIDFLKASINHVIGYSDVIDAFTNFRISFFNKLDDTEKTKENIEKYVSVLFPKEIIQKPMLSLYFHQELVAKSVVNRIREKPQTDKPHYLCVGVLPRGGKSFIAGGIMNLHMKLKAKESGYNVLFLTSAVTETITQFKKDLINKFSDYDNFDFVDVREGDKGKNKNKFYFISRQLSSGTTRQGASDDTDVSLLNEDMLEILERKLTKIPEIDICFFDEAHIGITSKTVRENFNKAFNRFKIPIVLMTATYKKPAIILESSKDLFVWDLQDIKEMKTLEVLNLPEFLAKKPDVLIRYPIAEDVLKKRNSNGETEQQLAKPYLQFPNPNFISLTFSPETITKLVETGGGYSFMQAFAINNDDNLLSDRTKAKDWSKLLRNKEDAIRLRQFLTPEEDLQSQEENQSPYLRDKSRKFRALNQIFSIAQKNGSRPYQGKPFSILMFLPWGGKDDGPIGSLCRIWASFMLQSVYWQKNFVFLTLSKYGSKNDKKPAEWTLKSGIKSGLLHREDFDSSKELKTIIEDTEREALKEGKGLVLLSGDVGKMGISLKCVDVVFMMSNKQDADDIIQKMYRALTDNPPNKKDGFIVDLDLKRIITAMFEYDLEKDRARVGSHKSQTTEERLFKIFELCNWGQDSFIEDNPDKNFSDIMDIIKGKVLGDLEKKILKTFDENGKEIDAKQLEIIEKNTPLYTDIKATLETTSAKTKAKTRAALLATRGEVIPNLADSRKESNSKESEEKDDKEDKKPQVRESRIPKLSEAQIRVKIMYILKTFVNSLVLKSSEPWDKSLNLISLLEKYKKDEKILGGKEPVCDCTSNGDCTAKHDNLYESSYCELKSYAINGDESGEYKYDVETHKRIMVLINDIFTKNSVLIEWNTYIESLLAEMRDAKVKSRVSRRSRKLNRR